jgi:hypothetical protein
MARLNFPEWRPDLSDLNATYTRHVKNVIPRADGYGPVNDLVQFTDALPGPCRGYIFARNPDSSVSIFAGTSTNLYKLDNTTFEWVEVSQGGVDYGELAGGTQWSFAQFGVFLIAVQGNTPPQVFDITSDTEFSDLGGSPPDAGHVSVIGPFVVLSDLTDDPNDIAWSGVEDMTTWDGTNSSDQRTLPDGGRVRCTVPLDGDAGLIMQDNAVRRLIWIPGDARVFQIDRLENAEGILAPYSVVTAPGGAHFLSPKGFVVLDAAGQLTPIGEERINRTFLGQHGSSAPADLLALAYDDGSPHLVVGASDPKRSLIFWTYKTRDGAANVFDRLLIYHTALKRWALVEMSGEYAASVAQPGLTLEALDSISGSIDDLPFSLDDVSTSTLPAMSVFDTSHRLALFTGDNLEAEITTSEQALGQRRMNVNGMWPITDAADCYCALLKRNKLNGEAEEGDESAIDDDGRCPMLQETRYARARLRVPAAEPWTFATGVDPEVLPAGEF